MPYENDDESSDEFVQLLSLIVNLIYILILVVLF